MRTEVVHDEVKGTIRPMREQDFLPKAPTGISRLGGRAFPNGLAGVGRKGAEPLQGTITFIPARASVGTPAPRGASPWNGLQRSHLIEADDMSPLGWVAVQTYNGVFFTSKSGSLLLHQVWPVRKRRP